MRATKATIRWISLLLTLCVISATGPVLAGANVRVEELRRCLHEFDGIKWKLPYLPPIRINSCATSAANYNAGGNTLAGRAKMELIGELVLGQDASGLSSDERYAALQMAMYTYFDALFRERGYHLVETEQGNARTERSAYTQCMLAGGSHCVEDAPEPAAPPIPYVSLARYARQSGADTVSLTYKTEAKNTWSISIEGMPDSSAGEE